jgi:tRNA pseudouridine38-40 synthase
MGSSAGRIALKLAYLGTGLAGWQRQANARTVQGELEAALARVCFQAVPVVGAGRTDAGVHATGQVAHCDLPLPIPPAGLARALNTVLPAPIRVVGAHRVAASFHARNSALGKSYRYRLGWGAPLDPWEALRRWEIPRPPDLERVGSCLDHLVGSHDFAAFALSGHAGLGARGTTRTIHAARVVVRGRCADLVFDGDGFLRGMVRRLLGALLEVGRGARPESWFLALLAADMASPPAPTAPAHGLTLEKVHYRAVAHP